MNTIKIIIGIIAIILNLFIALLFAIGIIIPSVAGSVILHTALAFLVYLGMNK